MMRMTARGFFLLLPAVLLALSGVAPAGAQEAAPAFAVSVLASNRPGLSDNTDSRLVDPWGMAAMRAGPWWIANSGSGRLTTCRGDGLPVPILNPLSVAIPGSPGGGAAYAHPTGLVFNDGVGFEIEPSAPAWFIAVTRDGQVAGWFPGSSGGAVITSDQAPDAGFTGAALAGNRLYVANFRQKRVDVFDEDFSAVDLGAGAFIDPGTPQGLSPYNAQSIGNRIVVTYAAPDDDGRFALPGPGHVAVFDRDGRLLLSLRSGPWMNAPWGVAAAPKAFGKYGNDMLVANTGSGGITVFDPETGAFQGYLRDRRGAPIQLPGLHGLAFGNDDAAGPSNVLYFTAGPDNGRTGIFGSITPIKAQQ